MSTSRLQRRVNELLSIYLGQYTIRENTRPEWMEGLELDFYIEELHAAVEVQGEQHYRYIPHFHGTYDGFLAQRERDALKYEICAHLGIALYEVADEIDALTFIERMSPARTRPLPFGDYVSKKSLPTKKIKKAAPAPQKKKDPVQKWTERIARLETRIENATAGIDISALKIGIEKAQNNLRGLRGKNGNIETKKARKAGRKKTAKAFEGNLYLVSGGLEQHVVWLGEYENPDMHICDCYSWHTAKNRICSHIFCVAISLGIRT